MEPAVDGEKCDAVGDIGANREAHGQANRSQSIAADGVGGLLLYRERETETNKEKKIAASCSVARRGKWNNGASSRTDL